MGIEVVAASAANAAGEALMKRRHDEGQIARGQTAAAGFIAPCLPGPAPQAPSGELWLYEINAR
jgi:hypothetical protein